MNADTLASLPESTRNRACLCPRCATMQPADRG
jgi:hypothetical protein